MSANRLIALTGPAGCGKDTVADLLVAHCDFVKLAFADPLRNEVADAYGINVAELTRRDTKEQPTAALALRRCQADGFVGAMVVHHLNGKDGPVIDLDAPRSPRQIMQWWGTEYRRRTAADYWTRQTTERVAYLFRHRITRCVVLTDCRFDNEADMVRRSGGLVWQVKRPGLTVAAGAHASEVSGEAFKPDAVIDNCHDMRHLQQLVLGEFWALDAGLEPGAVRVEITT